MRFTSNTYPREQREDAWRFALQRHAMWREGSLGPSDDNTPGVYGELVSFRSERGIDFARVTATAQRMRVDFSDQADLIWLVILLEGKLAGRHGSDAVTLRENDMIYGGPEVIAELDLPRDHRFLLVTVPRGLLNLPQRGPLAEKLGYVAGDAGAGRVVAGMLRSVADAAGELDEAALRPIEMILPEFVVTSVLENAPVRSLGGAAGMRAAQLQRIYQTIEMRLSDPRLNLQEVANEHGISPRYLQKLFEEANQSFSHYVRLRRLERCRLDMASPLHSQRSITEILFQWGFNDSASFSRAFRDEYGMSPRQYRKAPPSAEAVQESTRRGRPEGAPPLKLLDDEFDRQSEEAELPASVDEAPVESTIRHHFLPATASTVHWGYFSRKLKPVLSVRSGDFVTIETLTHHANDDHERMVEGDAGAEDVYRWTHDGKAVERRGAGPFDASALGRGAGEGFGVHICTGPIAIQSAIPGDVVEIRILDLAPRPSGNPNFAGRSFGSNAAAYWGFHYDDLLTEPKPREVVTIYEIETQNGRHAAHAVYNYRWTPQIDPNGVVHARIDYPGVKVDPATIERNFDVLRNVEIPLRPHFGVIGLAPPHDDLVDSVPPSDFGGNLDNWRLGPGARIFLPVAVAEGLLSLGDPHASQGDSELCGTAIECSMTGTIQIVLHQRAQLGGAIIDLDYPLVETQTEWVIMGFSHPRYLKDLGEKAQSEVYKRSSIDLAMRDAFRKVRRFLMTTKGLSEDEAISLISVGIDFGISQVANGNWGVHAVVAKRLFTA